MGTLQFISVYSDCFPSDLSQVEKVMSEDRMPLIGPQMRSLRESWEQLFRKTQTRQRLLGNGLTPTWLFLLPWVWQKAKVCEAGVPSPRPPLLCCLWIAGKQRHWTFGLPCYNDKSEDLRLGETPFSGLQVGHLLVCNIIVNLLRGSHYLILNIHCHDAHLKSDYYPSPHKTKNTHHTHT